MPKPCDCEAPYDCDHREGCLGMRNIVPYQGPRYEADTDLDYDYAKTGSIDNSEWGR